MSKSVDTFETVESPKAQPSATPPLSGRPLARGLNEGEEPHQSMGQIIRRQFLEHRMAVLGALTILQFVLVALGAPLIADVLGLDPNNQNVFNRYKPPGTRTEIPAIDRVNLFSEYLNAHPTEVAVIFQALSQAGVIAESTAPSAEALLDWVDLSDGAKMQADLAKAQLNSQALRQLTQRFSTYHMLGTDELGRDVLVRLIYGTRVSIGVGVLVALVSALVGLLIGSLAGFYGGLLDSLLMRLTDSLLSLPQLPVLIVFAAVDLAKVPFLRTLIPQSYESIVKLVVILCLFSWMTVARLVRGSVLSLREREFVLASRTLGARDRTLILAHMLPNVMAPLLVTVTVNVGQSILWEASLSFLGLGIQPPTPSWGNMLSNAQELMSVAPLLAFTPGFLIFLTVISFNFVGDGLQAAINPRSIKR